MRKQTLLYSLILVLWGVDLFCHPVHVSVSNIEYNKNNGTLSVSVRLFTDDLELLINSLYSDSITLTDKKNTTCKTAKLESYICDNLIIIPDNDTLLINLTDVQYTEIETVCTFEAGLQSNFRTVEIINTLMNQLYHDQINLVIFATSDFEKGLKFTNNESKAKFFLSQDKK